MSLFGPRVSCTSLWATLKNSSLSGCVPNLAKLFQLAFKITNLACKASKMSPFAFSWTIGLKNYLRLAGLTLGWAARAFEQPWIPLLWAEKSVVQKLWPILQTCSKWAPNLAKLIQLAFKITNLVWIASTISPIAFSWKIRLKNYLRWACLTLGLAARAFEQSWVPLFWAENDGLRGVERLFGHKGMIVQLRPNLSEVEYGWCLAVRKRWELCT